MAFRLQDPGSKLDHTIDFVDFLDSGVTIPGVPTWSIDPTGPTLSDQADATPRFTIFVSELTLDVVYLLTCKAVTDKSTPQTVERTIVIRCEHR